MKILVLSLLRLGDILLHKQVIHSLKEQYPLCQVDFAINDAFASCQELLLETGQVHLLPRSAMQRILVEQEQSSLAAVEALSQFIETINKQNYDLILDATHNRLSVKLCPLLEARDIRFAGDKNKAKNLWESYFNNQFSQVNQSRFHYVDVLNRSLGLKSPQPLFPKLSNSNKIIFQVLTSDAKKNWGLQNFRKLIDQTRENNPQNECIVVCAPSEVVEIQKTLPASKYDIRVLGLVEVREELKTAALLVSGDTSIQHLAAEVGCKVVSVFIGSADSQKTAPFIKNAKIIEATSNCYPCKHSEACYQSSHLCSATVSVDDVYKNILSSLKGDLMSSDNASMNTLRTDADLHGFVLVAGDSSEKTLGNEFERIVWSYYLNEEWRNSVPTYGSTVFEILNDWTARYSVKAISQFAAKYQHKVEALENLLYEGKCCFTEVSRSCLSGEATVGSVHPIIAKLKSWHMDAVVAFPEHSDSFLKLNFALHKDYQETFSLYRELKSSLDEPLNLNLIRKQLLINLVRSLSEKGELYGRELGILS